MRLWDYNLYLRHKYFETLSSIEWGELVKHRGASFDSLRNVFVHIVNCEDWYLHTVLLKKGGPIEKYDYEEFSNMDLIKNKMDAVEAKTKKLFVNLSESEYKKPIDYTMPNGTNRRNSIEEVLVNLIFEETHHRGELLGFLWAMNIEPPFESLIAYLMKNP